MSNHDTQTHFVKSADYEIGDLLYSGSRSHRIVRFKPYMHPVPEVAESFGAATRIAYCDDGYAITMTEHGSWPMDWDRTPAKYRERFLAAKKVSS